VVFSAPIIATPIGREVDRCGGAGYCGVGGGVYYV
jgi:hypothetical protein